MEETTNDTIGQSSTATSKRVRRATSTVWADFTKLPVDSSGRKMAKCRFCKKDYVADLGTSSLKRHALNCLHRDLNVHPVYEFDQVTYREKVATSIIRHNYPFTHVEHEGAREVHCFLNPSVRFISRNTAKADVLRVYKREKELLRPVVSSIPSRICLTSDVWSSITTDGYLALTAHYIDDNWKLQKKVLNFRHVPPPHSGPVLAERVIHLLKEWGIERKIFSVTLDNAKYNDGLVETLKGHFRLSDSLVCGGEFFHVRCGAHILNLIVQAGLKVIDVAVHNIRESVKYVRGSEARKLKFAECIAEFSGNNRKVRQDVPTRWNSTYLMLENALSHRLAFAQLTIVDTNFKSFPTAEEWSRVEKLTKFLKPFYDITTLFSGSLYPTANLFFQGVWKIQLLIQEMIASDDEVISSMAKPMKEKFEKYWDCYSQVLSMAVVLDPRYKIQYIGFCFKKIDEESYKEKVDALLLKMYELLHEYVNLTNSSSNISSPGHGTIEVDGIEAETEEFELFESQQYGGNACKSELTSYLEEHRISIKENADLDILGFWKANKIRYPNLSLMARDILSIPITTVASESSFSIGARIIDKVRSSITPDNAEALLCTRDWLYGVPGSEDLDEVHGLVEDFEGLVIGTTSDIPR